MSSGKEPAGIDRKQKVINFTLAVAAGQVGCLTLAIVLVAILAGLWLDNHFQTRPTLTLVLVVLSVPISVIVMLAVVRSAVGRIKTNAGKPKSIQTEEEIGFGKDA